MLDPSPTSERAASPRAEPGATWWRCDLHVHTPFDPEKGFGEDIQAAIQDLKKSDPTRLATIAENFVDACRAADHGRGVDLVALTDHNSIEGYRRLRPQFESIADRAKDEGKPMPAILPGVEFSVGGERPLHFLTIFASQTCPEDIENAIRFVFGERERFDPRLGTPRATGESVGTFLEKLYKYAKPATGERDLSFVLLPAHADGSRGVARESGAHQSGVSTGLWDEMKGHLRQWAVARTEWNGFHAGRPFSSLPDALKDLLCRWTVAKQRKDWDRLSQLEKQRVRERPHWPIIECSDPHGYEAVGRRYTWLKMEVPDVEGIRLALLDPESRLRRMADGPPGWNYPRIERLKVAGTDFFEDVEIPFNPCLTALIGGRGTGKSTVIEYLRYTLDRARRSDLGDDEAGGGFAGARSMLRSKVTRDFGQREGTLLPEHVLTADVVVAERRYRIRRSSDGVEVIQDWDQPSAQAAFIDVRRLLAPRILSQRQIADIARDPSSQRRELDALIDSTHLREIEDRRRSLGERLAQLQGIRRRLLLQRAKLPSIQTELQTVRDQIAFLEGGGREEILSRFAGFERERRWLEDFQTHVGEMTSELAERAEVVGEEHFGPVSLPDSTPAAVWLRSVADRLAAAHAAFANILDSQGASLQAFASEIRKEQSQRWDARYDRARAEYTALRHELAERRVDFAQHEKLLQRRAQLEREIATLERSDQDLSENARRLRDTRVQLVEAHEARLAARRKQAQSFEKMDADVRVKVHSFGDRDDFELQRRQWFSGAGLHRSDWAVLCDYVFSRNGEIPDRIAALTDAIGSDMEAAATAGGVPELSDSKVGALVGSSLTRNFLNVLVRPARIRLNEMERFLPDDLVEVRVRTRHGAFKTIETGSVGEKSTAILGLLLSAGDQPIIIDQPEDDLDNQYVYNVVVDLLRRRKFSRQVIVASHNANIPVNGDAESIVALGSEEGSGVVLDVGSIDHPDVKGRVSEIMEGSAEAFRLRSERYGY